MIEIKHKITREVIKTLELETLIGANLSGANLIEANLNEADLNEADLRGAKIKLEQKEKIIESLNLRIEE